MKKNKIIVIDDDETIRRSMLILLEPTYEVTLASSGKEALEILEKSNFSCIISDYDMDNGNGLFVLEQMKNKEIPFVLITGRGEKDLFKKFANRRVFYIYEKPIKTNITETIQLAVSTYMKNKNEKTMSFLGKNSGRIIHDINNNLGIIMLSSEVGESISLDQNQKILFQKNTTACSNITKIIEKYKKITNGEALDVSSIQISALSEFFSSIEDEFVLKPVSYKFYDFSSNNLSELSLDIVLIKQVVLNLIANSKYALLDAKTENPLISISLKQENSTVILSISDNGPGFSELCKDKLFTACNSSKGEKGTGMGLFYCKDIIDLHFGKFWLSKSDASGTEFCIQLPLTKEK